MGPKWTSLRQRRWRLQRAYEFDKPGASYWIFGKNPTALQSGGG